MSDETMTVSVRKTKSDEPDKSMYEFTISSIVNAFENGITPDQERETLKWNNFWEK